MALGSFWYWAAYPLASNDTAWLARTGQYILASGRLPAQDLFSWTCTTRPWVLYQWLFEIALGLIFNAGGPRGLWISGLLATLSVAVIYFYLLPRQWLRLRIPLPVILPFLALALSPSWFFIRPQLVSNLFTPIFINACERFRRNGKVSSIAILPLLMIFWANCHPLWLVGLLITGVYVLHYYTDHLGMFGSLKIKTAAAIEQSMEQANKEISASQCNGRNKSLAPFLVLALCMLVVLVNPYGADLLKYEWYFSSVNNFKTVNELKPLFVDPPAPFYPFIVFLVISTVILIWKAKAVPLPGLILSGFGLLAVLSANKFSSTSALLIWPYLGFALSALGRKDARITIVEPMRRIAAASRSISRYLNRKGGVRLFLLGLICSFVCYQTRIPTADFAIIVFTYNDIETMKFLFTHNFRGRRVFNDEPTGSLMIYFNILPVFCDGRVDFYGKEFCEKWLSCINGEPGWQDYFTGLSVNEIVIRDTTGLYQELSKSSDWLRAYDNGMRSIWLPKNDFGKQLLNRWQSKDSAATQ